MRVTSRKSRWIVCLFLLVVAGGLTAFRLSSARERWVKTFVADYRAPSMTERPAGDKCRQVLSKAESIAASNINYDPAYVSIKYPGGDVPEDTGVCTDVVIRSFRTVGIDLQKNVHESMKKNKSEYPNLWGLKNTDTNIDHRRVPNLMVYFKKHGAVLPISDKSEDFSPCDIVTWDLGGGLTHIGVVSSSVNASGRPLIIHHIGGTPSKEDMLFRYKIIGHFSMPLESAPQ